MYVLYVQLSRDAIVCSYPYRNMYPLCGYVYVRTLYVVCS